MDWREEEGRPEIESYPFGLGFNRCKVRVQRYTKRVRQEVRKDI